MSQAMLAPLPQPVRAGERDTLAVEVFLSYLQDKDRARLALNDSDSPAQVCIC